MLRPVPGGGLDGLPPVSHSGAAPPGPGAALVAGVAAASHAAAAAGGGGGLLELKLTFKDGGASELHSIFKRVRERLQEAGQLHEGIGGPQSAGPSMPPPPPLFHLEDLPAYEPRGNDGNPPSQPPPPPMPAMGDGSTSLGGDTRVAPEKSGLGGGRQRELASMGVDDTAGFEESLGERELRERRMRGRREAPGVGVEEDDSPRRGRDREPPGPPPGYEEATGSGTGMGS